MVTQVWEKGSLWRWKPSALSVHRVITVSAQGHLPVGINLSK